MADAPDPHDAAGSTQPTASTLADNALVPVVARHDGWTPEKQRAFIENLADTGCVRSAAASVGMTPVSAYRLRRRSDARAFAAAWSAALERALEQLLPVALDRALNGSLRQRWYHGEMIAEERVHHDGLLLHLIARGRDMLAHGRERLSFTADWDDALARLGEGRAALPAFALEQHPVRNIWLTNCPPPPGFEGEAWGVPGSPFYRRTLADDEELGLIERHEAEAEAVEESRRRLFGLTLPLLGRRGRGSRRRGNARRG